MISPVSELRDFLRASLLTPVERDHRESPAQLRRRRVVSAVTLAVGSILLWWSLQLRPGDDLFYVGTLALAATWTVGALLSGRIYLGQGHTRRSVRGLVPLDRPEEGYTLPVVQSLALGLLLLVIFLAGAVAVSQVPALAGPVDGLLDHARVGSLPVVLSITMVNGIAEELFFRGALYAATPRRWNVPFVTAAYALTTVGSGVPLLVFAAVVLGVVTGLQRRITGGVLGPAITHITWSSGMLLLLPPILDLLR